MYGRPARNHPARHDGHHPRTFSDHGGGVVGGRGRGRGRLVGRRPTDGRRRPGVVRGYGRAAYRAAVRARVLPLAPVGRRHQHTEGAARRQVDGRRPGPRGCGHGHDGRRRCGQRYRVSRGPVRPGVAVERVQPAPVEPGQVAGRVHGVRPVPRRDARVFGGAAPRIVLGRKE